MVFSFFTGRTKDFRGSQFDAEYYLRTYPDVADRTKEGALRHYKRCGRKEGRVRNSEEHLLMLERMLGPLPMDFDDDVYRSLHLDVAQQYSFARGPSIHYLTYGRAEGREYVLNQGPPRQYDEALLHLMMNRVFDAPEVIVDVTAPKRVNVLVPAFDFKSMSAGFFGVFQVARYICRCGFNVRLVLFDNFYWNYDEFCEKLAGYPGMEQLYEELEIEYIGERLRPLRVSPDDRVVATVWYSAYFAEKIMSMIGESVPFLYLIQDYETNFFPASSLFALADDTYSMNYTALFSTDRLLTSFQTRKIGNFGRDYVKALFFNNACSAHLPDRDQFLRRNRSRRRLAFYSRPDVNRNMFELGALALCAATREGVFDNDWDFFGVGMGNVQIDLSDSISLKQLPRMNLKEYLEVVSTFDVGLCLMASPHPSLLPFDLAGSGAIVLTNEFGVKTQDYFSKITHNIVAQKASLASLVDGLRKAVEMSSNLNQRYENAASMRYPRSWSQSFNDEHLAFIRQWAG